MTGIRSRQARTQILRQMSSLLHKHHEHCNMERRSGRWSGTPSPGLPFEPPLPGVRDHYPDNLGRLAVSLDGLASMLLQARCGCPQKAKVRYFIMPSRRHPRETSPWAVQARNRLGEWVSSIGVADKEASPTHGWRHTFKQIPDRVSDAITGHAPPTQGRAYGAPTLEDMANALRHFKRYKID
jgi:hypothetical protein